MNTAPQHPRPGPAAATALGLIRAYQYTLSPVLPVLLGPGCNCRYNPTCSHYAAQAVATHGLVQGGWLAAKRLMRCTPLNEGGDDPVPEPRP